MMRYKKAPSIKYLEDRKPIPRIWIHMHPKIRERYFKLIQKIYK